MTQEQLALKEVEVGASRAARGILGSLDRRLVAPAGMLIRASGWALLLSIVYMTIFESLSPDERLAVYAWLAAYALYIILLEILRKVAVRIYDTWQFRAIRIGLNLILVSVLVAIAPAERHLLIFAYILPIFATIVYFAEYRWVKVGVFFLALIGLYAGGVVFPKDNRIGPFHLLLFSLVIAGLSVGFEILRNKVNLVPSRLPELAREFHKTLDLRQLIADVMRNAIEITQAQRGLIILVNPRNKKYVGHILFNFTLRADRSIEGLAGKCFVLVHDRPFQSPDIIAAFNDKTVYHEFFDSQPRSVMAEPLHNRAGLVMGVINVAHNAPNGFDKISQSRLKEFAFLVGNAIENCLEHREVKLREAKSREAGKRFVSARSEDEAVQILIEEARQQIAHAEKLTLHKYLPSGGDLLPIYSVSPETTPRLFTWSNPRPKGVKPDMRLGYGIAGHALELRDTILAHDVSLHPWFVHLDAGQNITSLLVAPLFDPEDNELYGTISLESARQSAFNLEDESTLTYLSTQASRAIAKFRDFQAWREQGGTWRKMLEQIRSFDITGTESELCEQIAEAATRLLGFRIARIRILSQDGMLITKAVAGVSESARKKLMEVDLPLADLQPFLDPNFRAESSYLIRHGLPGWGQLVDKYFHKPRQAAQKKSMWDAYDALLTPLLDPQGNIMGLLTLDLPLAGPQPSKLLLEMIGVFANATSWMIELSRSQRRLKDQQYRAQSFIDAIGRELAKGRDLPTISDVVVQVGAKLLSAEGCSLYIVRGSNIELTCSNYLTDYRVKPISSAPGSGLTAWVAATGKTLCFNNGEFKSFEAWAREEDHLSDLPSRACNSVLMAPIKDKEDKTIGVLTLENKRTITGPKNFDDEDMIRLESLAGEFAKALEVIGLYEDIREWERSGLAEDLHDLINWYHSGVVSWIGALNEWLKQGNHKKAMELMPELLQHAYTTVNELKTLHTNILKKSFEAPTLRQALEEVMSVWSKGAKPKYEQEMKIHLVCQEDLEIPIRVRNTIVRIASLAFSNAIQHSGIVDTPRVEVWVKVEQSDGQLTLSVIDNGNGMDAKNMHPGYGLDRMRQLCEKINFWGEAESELRIESTNGQGTGVYLHLAFKKPVAV